MKGKSIEWCQIIPQFINLLAAVMLGTSLPFAGSQLGLESQANWDALPAVYRSPGPRGASSVEGSVDPSRHPVLMALWT